MKQVTFVFATGASWLDRLVTSVTRSPWSHVALRFDNENVLVEILAGRGFIIHPSGKKYDDWPISRSIHRQISEQSYVNMLTLCRYWEQKQVSYGYITGMVIGMKEFFGVNAASTLLAVFAGLVSNTMVCSELMVNLWRQVEPDFLPGQDHRLVSPNEFYQALLQQFPEEIEDKIDKPPDCAYNC